MKVAVMLTAVANLAVAALDVYVVLWVFDLVGSAAGDTHWRNPLVAGVLGLFVVGGLGVSLWLMSRLFRAETGARLTLGFFAASVVTCAAGVALAFQGVVTVY